MDKKTRMILSLVITVLPILMLALIVRVEGDARNLLTFALFLLMGIGGLAMKYLPKKTEDAPAGEVPEEELPEFFRSADCMHMMDGITGTIYSVVRDGQKYLFMKIGGEVRGLTVDTLPEPKMYSEAVLEEMGIKHFFLRREELTGYSYDEKPSVSTNWKNSGTLTFHGKKRKKYILLDTLEPRQVHSFMAGVPNVTPERITSRNSRARDAENAENRWLDDNQDPERMKKMKLIGTVLSVCSYVAAGVFMFLGAHYKLLSAVCLAGIVVCLALEIRFPAYFTLIEDKKDAAKRGHKPRVFLGTPFFMLMTALSLRALLDFSYTSWTGLLIGTAIVAGIILLILGLWAVEFRNRKADLAGLAVVLLFFSMGIVGQLNYLLDFSEPRIYYTEVVDHHVSSGKSTSYYCTVLLENGEEFEVQVSRDQYYRIDVGDWVKTVTRSGGLGIEYIGISQ